MVKMNSSTLFSAVLIVLLVVAAIYFIDPTFFGLLGYKYSASEEGYEDIPTAPAGGSAASGAKEGPMNIPGEEQKMQNKANPNIAATPEEEEKKKKAAAEGFQDIVGYDSGDEFATTSSNCYAKDQLTPAELLPKDQNSTWAQQNPMTGSLKGKQFLSSGALIGINTVGGSLRNASHQLRSEPPNPQQAVSIWLQSTIEPDINRRPLEIQ
jgi:hypothetical protein